MVEKVFHRARDGVGNVVGQRGYQSRHQVTNYIVGQLTGLRMREQAAEEIVGRLAASIERGAALGEQFGDVSRELAPRKLRLGEHLRVIRDVQKNVPQNR